MKILIFRTCSVPININSYNVQEIGLAKALIDSGNECDIIFYTKEKNSYIENISYKSKTIKIYWMKGFNLLHHGIYNFKEILEITEKYDVIQCSDYNQVATYKMLKLSSKPVIIYHGPYKNKFSWKTNITDYIFDILYLKKMLKIQPTIISKSALARDTLLDKGFENIITIPVGLDISRFLGKNEEKLNSNKKIMLYIGQISKRRSIDFLIDVEKEISKKYDNSVLVLIGNGNKRYLNHILKRIENEKLRNNIKWIKKLPQEELCKYYNSSSVFLLPSRYEIFGMVLLEANYFNLPIVSTLNGGAISVIKDTSDGYIVKDFNIDEWSNKISLVFNDERKKKKFSNTWNDRVKSFLTIYEEVTRKK